MLIRVIFILLFLFFLFYFDSFRIVFFLNKILMNYN